MIFPTVYQIAFSSLKGISIETANEILSDVGTEENFFRMSDIDLQKLSGTNNRIFDDTYRSLTISETKISRSDCKTLPMRPC